MVSRPVAEIKTRIKQGLNDANMKQIDLSRAANISKSSISQYLSGYATPKSDRIVSIAKALNVSEAWLLGYDVKKDGTEKSSTGSGVKINVLGRVAAGIPISAIEYIVDQEEIPEEMAARGSFFGLKIKGDSMEPRIYDGDIVIVRCQDDAETGDTVIAIINGSDATCKRLKKHPDGILLISLNSNYEPMFFSKSEIQSLPVRIIGKVVECRTKF